MFGKTLRSQRKYRDIKLVTAKKKTLFGFRAKLLHHKDFHEEFACNRNENDPNNYEWAGLLRFIDIRFK